MQKTEAIEQQTETKKKLIEQLKSELKKVRTYRPKVGVFGDTGVGKSSLCNALFGKETAKISNVEACTREPQHILIGDDNEAGITLIDVPGIGEDLARHKEYIELYKKLLPELDLVLWVFKGDDRKYMSSLDAYNQLFKSDKIQCPVLFIINQVDKIEPIEEWYDNGKNLGVTQIKNLNNRTFDICKRFDIPPSKVVGVCTKNGYGLIELVNTVVDILPNDKKSAFTREAKKENVSEEAAKKAEKGVFDHIKEKFEQGWDYIKDSPEVVAVLVEYAPKALKKVWETIKGTGKWF